MQTALRTTILAVAEFTPIGTIKLAQVIEANDG
jgi:hypothetical protein